MSDFSDMLKVLTQMEEKLTTVGDIQLGRWPDEIQPLRDMLKEYDDARAQT